MRAIQLEKPLQFRLIDIPEPESPLAGEAVVRVHRIGICGTDLSGYLGEMPFFSYPRIPGHELGVEVVAVGSGVEWKPGYVLGRTVHQQRTALPATKSRNCTRRSSVLGVTRWRMRLQSSARGAAQGNETIRSSCCRNSGDRLHAVLAFAAAKENVLVIGAVRSG